MAKKRGSIHSNSFRSAAESHLPEQGKFEITRCSTIYEALHQWALHCFNSHSPTCDLAKLAAQEDRKYSPVPDSEEEPLAPSTSPRRPNRCFVKIVDAGIHCHEGCSSHRRYHPLLGPVDNKAARRLRNSPSVVKKGRGFEFSSIGSSLVQRGSSSVKCTTSVAPKRRKVKREESPPEAPYTIPLYRDDTPPPDSTPPNALYTVPLYSDDTPPPDFAPPKAPVLIGVMLICHVITCIVRFQSQSQSQAVRSSVPTLFAVSELSGHRIEDLPPSLPLRRSAASNERRAGTSAPSWNLLGRLPQRIEIVGLGEGGPPPRKRAPTRSHVPASRALTSHNSTSHAPSLHTSISRAPASHALTSNVPALRQPALHNSILCAPAAHALASNVSASRRPASHNSISCTPTSHSPASNAPAPASRAPASNVPASRVSALHDSISRTATSHAPALDVPASRTPTSHDSILGAPMSNLPAGAADSSHAATASASGGNEFFYNKVSKMIYKDMEMMMEEMGDDEAVAVVNTVQEMRAAISSGGVLMRGGRKGKGKARQEDVDMEG
ncbi:hypothetical protein K438DRAFT_2097056 [Mycena galopus ATCC 62051]|nr:hypothetical protein K438DRAFT_2097056 [Mycena galopus ATCC 62051]